MAAIAAGWFSRRGYKQALGADPTLFVQLGKQRLIIETEIGNQTQDKALVHFADDQTQRWLLVRLNEPTTADASKN